jgi:hypothetical protein
MIPLGQMKPTFAGIEVMHIIKKGQVEYNHSSVLSAVKGDYL